MKERSDDASATKLRQSLRDEILDIAMKLFTLNGFRGVSFSDIAQRLDTTTANIHYHFKNKQGLAYAAVDNYASRVADEYASIWTSPNHSLAEKFEKTIAFNRRSYKRFNTDGVNGQVWSLLTRFAGEMEAVSNEIQALIADFRASVFAATARSLRIAIERGELRADTPVAELSRTIAYSIFYAGEVARDTREFDRVVENYHTILGLIYEAYGSQASPRRGRRSSQNKNK